MWVASFSRVRELMLTCKGAPSAMYYRHSVGHDQCVKWFSFEGSTYHRIKANCFATNLFLGHLGDAVREVSHVDQKFDVFCRTTIMRIHTVSYIQILITCSKLLDGKVHVQVAKKLCLQTNCQVLLHHDPKASGVVSQAFKRRTLSVSLSGIGGKAESDPSHSAIGSARTSKSGCKTTHPTVQPAAIR